MWNRRGKDTDGSTGERNNKNYMGGRREDRGVAQQGGKIQMGVLVKGVTQKLYGGKREDRGVAQEGERYRWEYW